MKIKFVRGDTNFLKFHFQDSQGNELLIGENEQLYFTVKQKARDRIALFQKKIGNGITFSDGYYHIRINPADTDKLDFGLCYYDLELKSGETFKKTFIKDRFILLDEITHTGNEGE